MSSKRILTKSISIMIVSLLLCVAPVHSSGKRRGVRPNRRASPKTLNSTQTVRRRKEPVTVAGLVRDLKQLQKGRLNKEKGSPVKKGKSVNKRSASSNKTTKKGRTQPNKKKPSAKKGKNVAKKEKLQKQARAAAATSAKAKRSTNPTAYVKSENKRKAQVKPKIKRRRGTIFIGPAQHGQIWEDRNNARSLSDDEKISQPRVVAVSAHKVSHAQTEKPKLLNPKKETLSSKYSNSLPVEPRRVKSGDYPSEPQGGLKYARGVQERKLIKQRQEVQQEEESSSVDSLAGQYNNKNVITEGASYVLVKDMDYGVFKVKEIYDDDIVDLSQPEKEDICLPLSDLVPITEGDMVRVRDIEYYGTFKVKKIHDDGFIALSQDGREDICMHPRDIRQT